MRYSADESIKLREKDQRRWSTAFCAIVAGVCIANLGLGFQNVFGISQSSVSLVCKLTILILLIICLPSLLRKKETRSLLFLLFAAFFVFLIQTISFSENKYFYETALTFVVTIIPLCVCAMMIDDYRLALEKLFVTSVIICSVVFLFAFIYRGSFLSGYAMGLSSSLIIPVNVLILYAMTVRLRPWLKLLVLALIVVTVLSIFAYGSRGALAAIVFFFAIMLFREGVSSPSKLITKLLIVAAAVVLFLSFDSLVQLINDVATKAGFRSRTLTLLANGSMFSHDSGRMLYWQAIWENLVADPLAIRGIDSDYLILGHYCHNFVLQLWHNLGMFFGSLAIIAIFIAAFKTIIHKSDSLNDLSLLFLTSFIPIAFWSGNFWENSGFWVWITLYACSIFKPGIEGSFDGPPFSDSGAPQYRQCEKAIKHVSAVAGE